MRSSLSLPLVWLLLSCTAQDEAPTQARDATPAPTQPPAARVASVASTSGSTETKTAPPETNRRTQKAGRSHDLRRAAMVDLVTRRLAVTP